MQDALENIAFTFEGGSSLNFAEGGALWVPRDGSLARTWTWRSLICWLYDLACPLIPPPLPPRSAALVIQGSACVYSKKVEYLHALVFQALEYLAESRCDPGVCRCRGSSLQFSSCGWSAAA